MVRQRRPATRTPLAGARVPRQARYPCPTPGTLSDALKSRPLWRRRCGWESAGEIPSEPTFSRACAVFAQDPLPQQSHEHWVQPPAGSKLVGHVSRAATAINQRLQKRVWGACFGFDYARAAEVSITMAEPAFGSPTRCANEYAFGGQSRRGFLHLLTIKGHTKNCRRSGTKSIRHRP